MKAKTTRHCQAGRVSGAGRRAFTLLEILFTVLILGLLMGLLIGGFRMVTRSAKETLERSAVFAVSQAVEKFHQDYGFEMPLVKDPVNPATPAPIVTAVGGRNQIKVYPVFSGQPSPTTPEFDFLSGEGLPTNANNPFLGDYRYSELSPAIYLAGGLDRGYSTSVADPTIDGVKGPGFFKPTPDGLFEVPRDLLSTSASKSRRTQPIAPLVNLGAKTVTLFHDPAVHQDYYVLRDRNNVAVRYYRWEHKIVPPAVVPELRLPKMVGRDPATFPGATKAEKDSTQNIELRGATWAIVSAGPNGVFGDEPQVSDIIMKLGMNGGTPELEARLKAESDNIVVVEGHK